MTEAEQKLIEGCIKGRRSAQNKLYHKYAPTLLGICMRYARNKSEAEDILQEGFLKIFSNISGFRGEGSFEGWLKRIIVNTAITYNKRNLKFDYHTNIDSNEEIYLMRDEETEELPYMKIPQAVLMKLIQNLPDGYRTVFNLYVFEQYTHQEIAEVLGISVNTSKSQLMKARRYLINKINELLAKEPYNDH